MKRAKTSESREKARLLLQACLEKQARDPLVLDLRNSGIIWDYSIFVTSTSLPHANAIVDQILSVAKQKGFTLHHVERDEDGGWVLIDYVDVIFNVFSQEKREFYKLERLFKDAKKVRFRFRK